MQRMQVAASAGDAMDGVEGWGLQDIEMVPASLL